MKFDKLLAPHQPLQLLQTVELNDFSSSPPKYARSRINQGIHVVCAWCKKVLRHGNAENGISHGICSHCSTKLAPSMEALRVRYVE